MRPSKEEVLEALASFREAYGNGSQYRAKFHEQTQVLFNRYLRLNKAYHGRYTPAKSPDFLK